jgi:hypothetical protein
MVGCSRSMVRTGAGFHHILSAPYGIGRRLAKHGTASRTDHALLHGVFHEPAMACFRECWWFSGWRAARGSG